jgi:hypothetical protein
MELIPCMDAWCKIAPCKCKDNIAALIAERDKLKADNKAFARAVLTRTSEDVSVMYRVNGMVAITHAEYNCLREALEWYATARYTDDGARAIAALKSSSGCA